MLHKQTGKESENIIIYKGRHQVALCIGKDYNGTPGLPLRHHQTEQCYSPQLIFSSNSQTLKALRGAALTGCPQLRSPQVGEPLLRKILQIDLAGTGLAIGCCCSEDRRSGLGNWVEAEFGIEIAIEAETEIVTAVVVETAIESEVLLLERETF